MFYPQRFDEVERVTALQSQIENHEIGYRLYHKSPSVGGVVGRAGAFEIGLAAKQLHEALAQQRMIINDYDSRFWLRLFLHETRAGVRLIGTRQMSVVPPARDSSSHDPPTEWAREPMVRNPRPCSATLGSNPRPLSDTVRTLCSWCE